MSFADEIKQVKWFTDFMTKYGINLVQYLAFATSDPSKDYDSEVEFKGAICLNKEMGEWLSPCYYGGRFFEYVVPHDSKSFRDENSTSLSRPKSAVGGYGWEITGMFKNNTIVHGHCESYEDHYFFAICIDNKVIIYNTYGGQTEMYIVAHTLEATNNMLLELTTPFDEKASSFGEPPTVYESRNAALAAKLFGYPQLHEAAGQYTFEMIHHNFLLPTPQGLIDYLTIIREHVIHRTDKKLINKAKSYLRKLI